MKTRFLVPTLCVGTLTAVVFVFYCRWGLAEQPRGADAIPLAKHATPLASRGADATPLAARGADATPLAARGADATPLAKPIVVPFETLKSGHMAVQIKVNGKGPYRVIFDTGAPIHLLNNKLAKEAGLLKDAEKTTLPWVGTVAEVKVKELQVGSAKTVDQFAIVMNHPLVELMSKKLGPLYGIVGYPFFARYRTTIDYQAETLTLVPNGFKPANVARSMQSMVMQLMTTNSQSPKVLSPAAQWGLTARKNTDDDEAGVDVNKVLAGSAAAEAGLKIGDRLLTIDGRWTDSLADLFEIASHLKPGEEVPIGIKRAGKEMELKIKLRAGL